MPEPKVSIIIPVYNGEKYLKEAIDSVIKQTYKNWELVLINDGCQDNSQKIIDEYVKKNKKISTFKQKNQGQSAARNFGVKKSSGEYVAFLDQDDRYYPHKLERLVSFLERRREYGMVYSDVDTLDVDGNIFLVSSLTSGLSGGHPKRSIIDCVSRDMFIVPGSTLIRREVFEDVGGFDPDLSGYEDDDLFMRIFRKHKIGFIKQSLLQWRIYADSCSYSDRMRKSRLIYFKKLCKLFPDNPRQNLYWAKDIIVPRFCNTFVGLIYGAKKSRDKKLLKKLSKDFKEIKNKPFAYKVSALLLSSWMPLFVYHAAQKIYNKLR